MRWRGSARVRCSASGARRPSSTTIAHRTDRGGILSTLTTARGIAVQSILYATPPHDVLRSARAVALAVRRARSEGVVGRWSFVLGDCSIEPVLDAAALDEARAIVAADGGALRYAFFGENLGHGGGHNRLAAEDDSELLLFLNPDSVLAPDALLWQVRALGDGVGAVDARQLPFEHPKDYDPVTRDASWASGSCLLTPRALFDEIGGFDHESFFLYCDDVDYSWRVRLAGQRVVHEPSARLFHDKRFDLAGDIRASAAERYYSAEAAVILALKYSRADIARTILDSFERSSDENLLRAREEVLARQRAGTLAEPLDRAGRVAEFTNGNYARHRF